MHDEPSLGHMQGMKQKVNATAQKEFLSQRVFLSDLFKLLAILILRVESEISVKFVEQKYVHTPYPVSLVESEHSLFVNALKCFKVSPVYWSLKWQSHS